MDFKSTNAMTKSAVSDRPSARGDSASPRSGEMVRRFGAAREERDDPSPLQDDMRYPRSARAGKSGWYREVFSPLTVVRGDSFLNLKEELSYEIFQ